MENLKLDRNELDNYTPEQWEFIWGNMTNENFNILMTECDPRAMEFRDLIYKDLAPFINHTTFYNSYLLVSVENPEDRIVVRGKIEDETNYWLVDKIKSKEGHIHLWFEWDCTPYND